MTILPYRNKKAAADDDASTSLAGSDSSASGGKTNATDSISMDYSDEEDDDVSLCYSAASSTAAPMVPIAIDEGFVVETSSVLSLDCSRSNKERGDNKPRRNLIGQRDLRSFRHSCQKLQQEASPKKVDDAANHRIPSIGMGPSAFHVTSLLKEGALYKRGSGGDILGREGWKHRHACLVLAKNQQIQSIEVPILLIYRNNSATMPSNIIPLDSAVVMATPGNQSDLEIAESSTNMANFDIVQAKKSLFFSDSVTPEPHSSASTVVASRSFAASKDEADAWVEKINTTLLQFEKRKAQAGIFVHKKQLDGNKLTQIEAENHWLDIAPYEYI